MVKNRFIVSHFRKARGYHKDVVAQWKKNIDNYFYQSNIIKLFALK